MKVVTIFSPNQIAVFLENLNVYFMKTANLPVYVNIAMLAPFGILISWTNVLLLYNFY